MRQRKKSIEESPKVPGYIVTFSDMVTLLLTFFVLLLTLAENQDPILFEKGRDSFIDSLKYVGLGMLFGRSNTPQLGNPKIKYSTDSPDETTENRTIDAGAEQLRRIREMLKKQTTIVPSPVIAGRIDYSITNIRFSRGSDELNEPARKYLTGFCRALQQEGSQKHIILYVLGMASEGRTEKDRWLLSARRANKVENYLRATLFSSSELNIRIQEDRSRYSIYSWGVGPGDGWADQDSPFFKQSQILIAVLRKTD